MIKKYFCLFINNLRLRAFINSIKLKIKKNQKIKKIIFFPNGYIESKLDLNIFFALLLLVRGHTVYIVCLYKNKSEKFQYYLKTFLIRMLITKNINLIFCDKNKFKKNINKKQKKIINFENHLRSSLIGHYSDERYINQKLFKTKANSKDIKFFQNEVSQSFNVIKYIYENYNFDLFIMNHGIYSTNGPIYDFLKNKKKNIFVYGYYGIALYDDVIYFSDTRNGQKEKSKIYNQALKSIKFSTKEKKSVEKYILSRSKLRGNDTSRLFNAKKIGSKKIENYLKKYSPKKIYFCFPNVMYDNNIHERDTIYKGISNWIVSTIKNFKNKDYLLVIRFHPAEQTILRNLTKIVLENAILNYFKKIPKNIIFISSSELDNSYELAKRYCDCAIVFENMIGTELPFYNIPVIACGSGPNNTDHVSLRPKNLNDYYKLINNNRYLSNIWMKEKKRIKNNLYKHHIYNLFYSFRIPFIDNSKDRANSKRFGFDNKLFMNNKKLTKNINKFLKQIEIYDQFLNIKN